MTRERLEEGHAGASDFAIYLEDCFQGEVYGEAVFRTMADLCTDPEQEKKLRILEQLERETKEALLPAVRETGGAGVESRDRSAQGEKLGAELAKLSWNDLLGLFQKEIRKAVLDFEAAEALAPIGKESLARQVTAHERALLDFANRELEGGQAGDSLESVIALLENPPTG